MTKHQAILAQFATALAAYAGTFVGLFGAEFMKYWMGSDSESESDSNMDWMIPFTAGGFVYVAAVNILPALLEERGCGGLARVAQVMAFLVGIGFMYGVAVMEEMAGGHDHGHSHGHGHVDHGHGHADHGHADHGHSHGHDHHHDHGWEL